MHSSQNFTQMPKQDWPCIVDLFHDEDGVTNLTICSHKQITFCMDLKKKKKIPTLTIINGDAFVLSTHEYVCIESKNGK